MGDTLDRLLEKANLYILKNEGGTQLVSKELDDLDKIIGVWKLKYVKSKFIDSLTEGIEQKNTSIVNQKIVPLSFVITWSINTRKKKSLYLEIVQQKTYLSVIEYIASISLRNDYITIHSILKHFKQTKTPIDKQVLLDMVNKKLLNKYYHRVQIRKQVFEYIKKIPNE